MSDKFLLKDSLFNEEKINYLIELLENNVDFEWEKFKLNILKEFPNLELKQRITHICINLEKILPNNYIKALDIILKSLPNELDNNKTDDDFWDFILAPFWEFIIRNGLSQEYLEISLNWIYEITKRFSMEFYIRKFLNYYPAETIKFLEKCSVDKNYHVRRLATEWTRPKLPWAEKININHIQTHKILDNLYYDNTRYVTRSVANHLNDISKLDEEYVINKLFEWKKSNLQSQKELDFIIKHSLRTLLKKWNTKALELIGINKIKLSNINFEIKNNIINLWDKLNFNLSIISTQSWVIYADYIVYFLLKNWKYSKKVYKIWTYDILKNKTLILTKSHLFNNFTTRKLYNWIHYIEIQINWKIYKKEEFRVFTWK